MATTKHINIELCKFEMYDVYVDSSYHSTISNFNIACDYARALCLQYGQYSSIKTQDMNKLLFAVSYSPFSGKLIEYMA